MAVWSEVKLRALSPTMRLDSEYYRPHYVYAISKLKSAGAVRIGSFADVTDGIHGSPEWVEEDGVRYLSAKSVKDNYFVIDNSGQISVAQDAANPRTRARLNDVLITTVGTIGNSAVVYDEIMPANMDRHLGIVRIRQERTDIDPYYLSLFFNTSFGRSQTLRESTGNVQLNLFIESIKNLIVPLGDDLNECGQMVRQAYAKRAEAEELYAQAETQLLEALGLNDLDSSHELTYKRDFKEVARAGRYDAEYFKPKYEKVFEAFDAVSQRGNWTVETIGQLSEPLKYGTSTPLSYIESGVPFLRIADVQKDGFDKSSLKFISKEEALGEKGAIVSANDVIVSRSGSLGLTIAIGDNLDGAVFGSYFIRTRPNLQKIHPLYFSLFMNSRAGQLQVERNNTGGVQTNLTIPAIENIAVAYPDANEQQEFVQLVLDSRQAANESQILLEQAKSRVEQLIEEGV